MQSIFEKLVNHDADSFVSIDSCLLARLNSAETEIFLAFTIHGNEA